MVQGLHTVVTITGHEAAHDSLSLHTFGGSDSIDASALLAGVITYTADGGDQDEVLLGRPGLDALDGEPGTNVVIQD
ncbi:MAG: hypothetical protein ACKV19_18220 [Verrucomicrobiales bacterium]